MQYGRAPDFYELDSFSGGNGGGCEFSAIIDPTQGHWEWRKIEIKNYDDYDCAADPRCGGFEISSEAKKPEGRWVWVKSGFDYQISSQTFSLLFGIGQAAGKAYKYYMDHGLSGRRIRINLTNFKVSVYGQRWITDPLKPGGNYNFFNPRISQFGKTYFGGFTSAMVWSVGLSLVDVSVSGYNTLGPEFYNGPAFRRYAVNEVGIAAVSATVGYAVTLLAAPIGPFAPLIGYGASFGANILIHFAIDYFYQKRGN